MEALAPFVPFVAGYLSTSRRSLAIACALGALVAVVLAVSLPATGFGDDDWTVGDRAAFFGLLLGWWVLGTGIGFGMRWVIGAIQGRSVERD